MNSVLEHANRDENHLGMVSCLGSARVEIAACSVGGRARGRGFLGKSEVASHPRLDKHR